MYGIASESIPELVSGQKKEEITPAQKELLARQCPDSFIIPQAPRNRSGFTVTARTSARTNAHILVEFGLRLFYIILKREKLRTGDFRPFVDPVVSVLCDCLKAQHIKVRKQ
jgi:U3 small nucleolar RNA-associated protein 20